MCRHNDGLVCEKLGGGWVVFVVCGFHVGRGGLGIVCRSPLNQ